jgi:hypothetical protein
VRFRSLWVAAALLIAAPFAPLPAYADPVPLAPPGGAATRADINGDGIADIVMSTGSRLTYSGDPDSAGVDKGGSIYVVPGGGTLPAGAPVVVSQDSHDFVPGAGEDGDRFGQTLVTGDFNGDGLADVAIGDPGEAMGSKASAGMVVVLYGKRDAPYLGLIPNGLTQVDQSLTGMPGAPGALQAGNLFGASLAAGDFDADGYADLAIGAPQATVGGHAKAGSVTVVYGGSHGIGVAGAVSITEDTSGIDGSAEASDRFGWGLASGDVTGDGRDDLAITAEGEAVAGTSNAWGAVVLVPGSATGVKPSGSTFVNVADASTAGDWRSVVIGRFHGGANADVVVTADERKGAAQFSGALVVARGGSGGLSRTSVTVVDQDSAGLPGTSEENDFWGGALAAGDLDGDGVDDLAVGALRENNVGMVTLIRGGGAGLLSAPGTTVSEDTDPIAASAQSGEGFGYGLRVLDVTGDGKPELLVSAPWEDGSLQSGVLFVLNTALAGDSITVSGARSLGRGALGSGSHFGPATPIAGGTVVQLESAEVPIG